MKDPAEDSPTATLLRLLLPLNVMIHEPVTAKLLMSDNLSSRSIGRSDGRCVQKAGTRSTPHDERQILEIPNSVFTIARKHSEHDSNHELSCHYRYHHPSPV